MGVQDPDSVSWYHERVHHRDLNVGPRVSLTRTPLLANGTLALALVLVLQVRKSGVTGRHMAVLGVKGGSFDLRADFKQREKDDTHLQTHRADVWIKER